MRLSLRFVLPLIVVLGLLAYAIIPLVDKLTLQWFTRDIELRSQLIANSLEDSLVSYISQGESSKLLTLFNRAIRDERLYAVGLCNVAHQLEIKTPTFPSEVKCQTQAKNDEVIHFNRKFEAGTLHVTDIAIGNSDLGRLILIHDMSFVDRRSMATKRYVFYLFLILGVLISIITVVIAQMSWKGMLKGMRAFLKGEGLFKPISSDDRQAKDFQPIIKDLRKLIRNLDYERQFDGNGRSKWNAQTIKTVLREQLLGEEVIVVSNREPYIHVKSGDGIAIQFPASGLVTALEPIMRACSGTWVAHGSGNADKTVVDKHDRVQVPPDHPVYQIRRVWLSQEEENGYYYGFSNEGLWPLCHIAHTRPIFRQQDFDQYVRVNNKFAQAVIEEAKTPNPVILVQDYHFALLPRIISQHLPKATIITFWHIPWPNPEAFGICPWHEQILDGLLGSSIIGFHTKIHCHNFIDTVDRFLECRIDHESSTVSYGKKTTAVHHYPISVEWPTPGLEHAPSAAVARQEVRQNHRWPDAHKVGIGVDRLDYTKGIVERFMAIERLLQKHPQWVGRFSFIQIAAPSRSIIERYQALRQEVISLAERINQRFSNESWRPIELKIEHHTQASILKFYRAADVCLVSSLHDGMNLVAKEFIASRNDEQGVLILSIFAGASRELLEALLVNPYDTEKCAQALHNALIMPPEEQKERMRSMRGFIQEYNVYRWAGKMLLDAAKLRRRNEFLSTLPHERS